MHTSLTKYRIYSLKYITIVPATNVYWIIWCSSNVEPKAKTKWSREQKSQIATSIHIKPTIRTKHKVISCTDPSTDQPQLSISNNSIWSMPYTAGEQKLLSISVYASQFYLNNFTHTGIEILLKKHLHMVQMAYLFHLHHGLSTCTLVDTLLYVKLWFGNEFMFYTLLE